MSATIPPTDVAADQQPLPSKGSAGAVEHAEKNHISRIGVAYGRFIYRIRWVVLLIWIAGLSVSAPFALHISDVLASGGYIFGNSESANVTNIQTNLFSAPNSSALVVFQSSNTLVTNSAYQDEIAQTTSALENLSYVTSVTKGTVSSDGKTTFLTVDFNQSTDTILNKYQGLLNTIPTAANQPAKAYLTGDVAINHDYSNLALKDVSNADKSALPIALVALLIIFGSIVAAFLPLTLALFAVPIALGIVYAIAVHVTTDSSVLSLASIIGLGLSIDYTLFMTRRFREELAHNPSVKEAVAVTVATAGEAILFSGLTVMIGFSGLLLIGVQFMSSLGIAGASIVLIAGLGALTLVPSILGILGKRVNALRIPVIGKIMGAHDGDHKTQSGFWGKLANGVMRFPIPIMTLVIILLLTVGSPLLQIRLGVGSTNELPTTYASRQGLDIFNQQFPDLSGNQITIAAETPDKGSILTADNLNKLEQYTTWLQQQNGITSVSSALQLPKAYGATPFTPDILKNLYISGKYASNLFLYHYAQSVVNNGTTLITVTTSYAMDSQQSNNLVNLLRNNRNQAQGLTILVGGGQASTIDFNNYLYGNFPKAILMIIAATYILLMIMFRSVFLPLKAVIVNILSISASYGVIVWIFQFGNLANIYNFTQEGYIQSFVPILMFCTLFGLSMDYEVFLLSRIREEWLRTKNNRFAVAKGLEMTGGVITNAAVLLIIVAGAIAFTSLNTTKEIGLGVSIAVLVDSTLVRILLVPAVMRLMGRWNWWIPFAKLPKETAYETVLAQEQAEALS